MNAQQIAAQGRYGDNTLVHASSGEVQGLDALSRSIYGHNLPRNPQTGLPEAFLFAPFLAPLIAGSMPALAGMGAVGTGLLAGGLGAAEAAARGMENPLQQGIMAGLTGGAAAGIGNALSAAGGATQAAAAAPGAAATGAGGLTSTADIASGAYKAAQAGAPTVFAPNPAMMAAEAAAPRTGLAGIGQRFSDMGRGINALMQPGAFKPGGVGQTFLKQAKIPALAGAAGLAGQSMLADQENALKTAQERDEEQRQRGMATQQFMSRTALPQYRVGVPYTMAAGGMVPDNNKTLIGYSASGEPVYADASATMRGAGVPGMESPFAYQDPEVLSAQRRGPMPVGTTTTAPGGGPSMEQLSAMRVGRSPQYQEFMRQLQMGRGNAAASQSSGYTGGRYTSEIPEEEMKMAGGGYLGGGAVPGDGMSDSVPAAIDGNTPAALSSGEFVMPADVVSGLGNGSSEAGAQQLYAMMDRIRKSRTGTTEQAPAINPNRMMVA